MKSFFYSIILLFLVVSCRTTDSEKPELPTIPLMDLGDIMLPLDSVTSMSENFYRLIENDEISHLFFFNPINHSLYRYDLDGGYLISTTNFEKDGPNSIGSRVTSFEVLGDSGYVFHSYYMRQIIYTNQFGVVQKRLKLYKNKSDSYATSNQNSKVVFQKDHAYYYSGRASYEENFNEIPVVIEFSLFDSISQDTGIRFPERYKVNEDEYLPTQLDMPTFGHNEEDSQLIVSFPLADSVITLDGNGNSNYYYFGSTNHIERKPLSLSKGPQGPMGDLKNYMRFSKYGSVHYDPYREVYLRTFYTAAKEELLEQNKMRANQSLLIADKEFKMLGEAHDLNGTDQILLSRRGLLQIMFSRDQEDSLKIKVLDYDLNLKDF